MQEAARIYDPDTGGVRFLFVGPDLPICRRRAISTMKAESRYLTFAIGIVGSSESSHAARTATRLVIEKAGRFVKEANDTQASRTCK